MKFEQFSASSNDVTVVASPFFVKEYSSQEMCIYFWAYNINIESTLNDNFQLISRYWKIIDKNGDIEEVEGLGVVGEQPFFKNGTTFNYTSGVSLKTPSGMMMGKYTMKKTNDDEVFEVIVPAFSLDSPFDEKVVS